MTWDRFCSIVGYGGIWLGLLIGLVGLPLATSAYAMAIGLVTLRFRDDERRR